MQKHIKTIQAHLFIGPKEKSSDYTHSFLQSIFCQNNSCNTCVRCNQLKQKTFSYTLWLKPENQYTLDDLDIVFKTISFKAEENTEFFIIFENADLLGTACSNRLLKSIEEPHSGYYFIFLAQRKDAILPTIRSRCNITYINPDSQNSSGFDLQNLELFNSDPSTFLKTIDKLNLNEHESLDLVNNLINYWSNKYKTYLLDNNPGVHKISNLLTIFYKAIENPPMPGGGKLFLKNLYIKINILNNTDQENS